MIDREIFLHQIALLADRIGRELSGPTQVEYHRQLSQVLTTEQFVAATALAFNTWPADYKTWPSPRQIIELIAPVAEPSLSANEAFERVLAITNQYAPTSSRAAQLAEVQALGANTIRAFRAVGGFRDFVNVLEADVVWLRRRFVEVYAHVCETADAEQQATLALGDAESRVQQLVSGIAKARAIEGEKVPRRIGA